MTDAGEDGLIEDRETLERALGDGESEWTAPEPIVSSPWIEEPQPDEPGVPKPWSEEPAGWDMQEPTVLEEIPVELDEGTPPVGVDVVGMAAADAVARPGGVWPPRKT